MFIETLQLKNFKTIVEAEYNFKKINAITGENGKGKTSLVEAITFHLTDFLNDKISEYVKWGKNKFESRMVFNHLNHRYDYKIIGSKSTERELIIDGDIENTFYNSDCVKEIAKIINPEIALYSNVSLQGRSTQLLFEKPTPRLDRLKSLFGMNDLLQAIDNIKIDIDANKTVLNTIETELKVLQSRTYTFQDIPEKKDYNEIDGEVIILESSKKNYTLKEVDSFDESVLADLLVQCHRLDIKKTKYDSAVAIYNKAQNKIKELEAKKVSLENDLSKYPLFRIKTCEYTEENITSIDKEINDCKVDIKDNDKKIDLCKQGNCPTCGQEYKADIKELIEKRNSFNIILTSLTASKTDIDLAIKDYNKKKNEFNVTVAKREGIENNIASVVKQIDENKLIELETVDIDFETQLKDLNVLIKIEEEKKTGYNLIIQENNKVIALLSKIDNDIKILTNKKQTLLEQQDKEIERINQFNVSIRKEKADNDIVISDKLEKVDVLRRKNILLDTAKKLLDKDFSSYLIDKGTEFIKNKMNEIFQKAYGRYSITLQRDNKGVDFFYSDCVNPITSVNMASGFEKQLLSMSFRMALSYLHNLNVFIFDETDSEGSEDNSLKLFNIIFNEMKNGQFFLISHKESVKNYLMNEKDCLFIEV